MTEEEKFVTDSFQKNFLHSEQRIAIYGIGKNTRLILETFSQNRIVGLMDAACKESYVYGKKLLKDSDITGNVDMIVVVARRAVHGIIYPRIKKFKASGIRIVDMEGKEIGESAPAVWDLPEWQIGFTDIQYEIDRHTCISFDLFDTLLMRRYLLADDVPKAAADRVIPADAEVFVSFRRQAETGGAALKDIEEIYAETAACYGITKEQASTLREVEFEVEKQGVLARKKMAELLDYARRQGKKVYILTDMYYAKTELQCLCHCAGIEVKENEILSSCEIQASKEDGSAFAYLKNRAGTDSILHIGDHEAYDCRNARASGIDAVHILSSYEMFAHSSLSGMLSDMGSYAVRCCMGLAAARLYNSPFALNGKKGRVVISDPKEFGYYMGAVFYFFSCWLICEAKKHGIEQMLLPGRDGWLVSRILDILKPDFAYSYVCASRRAYQLAAIEHEDDIRQMLREAYKGSQKELYMAKFHIRMDEGESESERFRRVIQEASVQREYLIRYLESSGIQNDLRTGVFDCVASGTVQSCLERLLGIPTQGFYFGTTGTGKNNMEIHRAFGVLDHYKSGSAVLEHYLLIENLLAETSGTLIGFEDGKMVFEDNVPSAKLGIVQEGILDFVKDAQKLLGNSREFAPDYCDRIVDAVFSGKAEIAEGIREIFVYDDSYLGEQGKSRIWQ